MDERNQAPRPRRALRTILWQHNVLSILACLALVSWFLYPSTPISQLGTEHYALNPKVSCQPHAPVRNVAIVGAGSGGASAAYFLSKFKNPCNQLNITVYERSDYIGGRSITVNAYDDPSEPVELGASIFVEVNRNLVSAVKEFGLATQGFGDNEEGGLKKSLGVYNGEAWIFRTSDSNWWDIAKMLWKYGTAPIRTQRLMKKTVGPFLKMYEEPVFPFSDLSQTASDLDLTEATASTGVQYMNENGIDSPFIQDIVQASTRVNYAQNIDKIHGLEAMVCMATDNAMSVRGGNWQIFASMLNASSAHVALNTSVHSIFREPNGTYAILAHTSTSLLPPANYDTVILAAPYKYADLAFSPPLPNPPTTTDYVNLHVTLFTSPQPLDPMVFGLTPDDTLPTTILTVPAPDNHPLNFFSISTLRLITNPHTQQQEYLYKIFSADRIDDSYLLYILRPNPAVSEEEMVGWVYRKLWQSYPYLPPRVTFEDIQLDEEGKLWYTSGIEGFISTMETSSLMGMNVAKLVVQEWEREGHKKGMVEKGDERDQSSGLENSEIPNAPDIPKISNSPPETINDETEMQNDL